MQNKKSNLREKLVLTEKTKPTSLSSLNNGQPRMSASIVRLTKPSSQSSLSHYRWTFDGVNFKELTTNSSTVSNNTEAKTEANGWVEMQMNYSTVEIVLEEKMYRDKGVGDFFKMVLEKFPKKTESIYVAIHKQDRSVRIWLQNGIFVDLVLVDGQSITSEMLSQEVDRLKSGQGSTLPSQKIYFKDSQVCFDKPAEGFQLSDYEQLGIQEVAILSTMKVPMGPDHRENYQGFYPLISTHVDFTPAELEELSKKGYVMKDKQFFGLPNSSYSHEYKKGFLCYTSSELEEASTINEGTRPTLNKILEANGRNIKTSLHTDFPVDIYNSIKAGLNWAALEVSKSGIVGLAKFLEETLTKQGVQKK